MKITPIILSGGNGSRLWPQSRAFYPKQFLSLFGDKTMLQNTLERVCESEIYSPPVVVANEEHRFIVAEQSRDAGICLDSIILEPLARNTAPAVAVAALNALDSLDVEEDALLLVLAADHVIINANAFKQAVLLAKESALEGKLVTFGVVPEHAETGYGYIKSKGNSGVQPVEKFVEKPDKITAENYVASGDYYWNSGMFLFSARQYLSELNILEPSIHESCVSAYQAGVKDRDFIRLSEEALEQCPDNSIDYAVMEKTNSAVVVPMDAGWCDVGSWSALWLLGQKDDNNNTVQGDVILDNVENCYVHSEKSLIAAIGVENLVITESDDALLIAHKDCVQDVKKVVKTLKENNRAEALVHRKVYRPWGFYDSVDSGERFQVKRITVNAGEKLSVQKHHHRAEHWVVVSGTAKVTLGDKELLITENQSTYIPVGEVHALENPGKIPLQLIEVQTGSYLGEDDIVRLNDLYGRAE
ncbi:mannose-1-phosphate guanyltransferase [Endozoicomonas montiporae]|uniref:mannose-1-phosphate guanylyltransferase n=2 Tax=Endozoicomonas montiporae TaxID=1027273 RepID=A0A081NAL1_9GAMM|nr:mannose-1-phosphate guanylyltransferase/mannose-6-phosphate isomerase [Endozoicomonas montiporae]AMO56838.1 mannose-1-phosphate guanylyltransferase (GDP) [Endozoicomonas montiporae CL-33]KEQ15484.1 mannose-1-phosphate guanyltransferase [Endozoicomonas montiporae]